MVFSKYTDLLPKEVLNDDAPELQRPDEEAVKEVNPRAVCGCGFWSLEGTGSQPIGLYLFDVNWI